MKWKSPLLIFILFILGFVIFMPVLGVQAIDNSIYYSFENDYLYDGSLPEVSNEFNIRNKTAGHYPATYSFENDVIGSEPEGWIITDGINYNASIISNLDGHQNVLSFNDNNNTNWLILRNSFVSKQESGTIEFWLRTTAITEKTQFNLLVGSVAKTWFYIQNSKFQYYDGSTKDIPNVGVPINNIWYRVRIDFECGVGGYLGLGADQIQYTINGVSSGFLNFAVSVLYIDGIAIESDIANVNYKFYFDSIGYSWDISYDNNYVESVEIMDGWGSIYAGDVINTRIDDTSYLTFIPVEGEGTYWLDVKIFFDGIILNNDLLNVYLFTSFDTSNAIVLDDDNNMIIESSTTDILQIIDLEIDVNSYLRLSSSNAGSSFYLYMDFVIIKTNESINYEIGDNRWISEMIPTNELEVDKFEFASNSTGDLYVIGSNVIENRTVSETNGNIQIVSDDGFDKCISFKPTSVDTLLILSNTYEGYTFDNDDYLEYGFSLKVKGFSYLIEFFTFKLIFESGNPFYLYLLVDADEYVVYWKNYTAPGLGETLIGYNKYGVTGINEMIIDFSTIFCNGTYLINYNDSIPYYHDNLPIGFLGMPTSERSFYFVAGAILSTHFKLINYVYFSYTSEFLLDYDYLYVNGESISNEIMPDNIYILNVISASLTEYNFISIDFNYDSFNESMILNNISMLLSNEIQLINYNENYIDGYFKNLYSDVFLNGFYLSIDNSSVFEILNIKIYGVKLHNEFTGQKHPLEFDYANVNIQESYFYVDDYNNLRFKLNITNDNLEYIQATFDVSNVATYDTSFIYIFSKTGLGNGYLRLNYMDATSTIFYLTSYTSSNNVMLPQDKIIDSFIILFSDNDDYNAVYTYGYVASFVLAYTSDYSLTIITVALMDTIIGLLVIILPSFLFSIKLGKKSIIPFMSIMSVACFIFGLIPMWLFFILMLCFGALLMVQYKGDVDVITN